MRSVITFLLIVAVLAFIAVSGCPSRHSGGGGRPVVLPAPQFNGYAVNPAAYTLGDPIEPNLPQVKGTFDAFTVDPALPAGLALDGATGAITGTPTAVHAETIYAVTAHRGSTKTTAALTLSVPPPIVVIVADKPLAVSFAQPSAASPLSGSPVAATGVGLTPDPAAAVVQTGNVAVKHENPPAVLAAPSAVSDPPAPFDATVPYMAVVTVTTDHVPVSVPVNPTLLDPYSSAVAVLPVFPMASNGVPADFREASLRLRLTQQGGANLTFESNAIPTHRVKVRQLSSGQDMTSTAWWMEHRGKLYYRSVNASGGEKLFVHDRSDLTFRQLCDLTGPDHDDLPKTLAEYNSRLYLRIRNDFPQKRSRLFRYDATTNDLTCISQTSHQGDDSPDFAVAYAGSLYFTSQLNHGKRKLFRYTEDATGAAVELARVVDTANTNVNDEPASLFVHAGALYFTARMQGGNRKLFRFDSASPGVVQQISDTAGGVSVDDDPSDLTEVQGKLYFTARNAAGVRKLWRYDANNHLIEQIADLRADPAGDDAPASLAEWNGRLYFTGSPSMGLTKLYRYDPASGALAQVSDTAGAGSDDAPSAAVGLGGSVYFTARNAGGARKVWRFDESALGLTQVSSTAGGSGSSDEPQDLTAYAGKLYFTSLSGTVTRKLYQFNAAAGIVCQVADTRADAASDDAPEIVAVYGGHLLFTAIPAAGGPPQLFRLCDEATGCND
jgi:outer membrane protein assembly factor BamB